MRRAWGDQNDCWSLSPILVWSFSHQNLWLCTTTSYFSDWFRLLYKTLSGNSGSHLADWSIFQTWPCNLCTVEAIHYTTLCVDWLMMTSPLQGHRRICHDNQCALLLDFPLQAVWRPYKETCTWLSAQSVEGGWNKRSLKIFLDTGECDTPQWNSSDVQRWWFNKPWKKLRMYYLNLV